MEVPCGQCIGCRLDRSQAWAIRCIHESKLYEDNCFITLTYSPENLPYGGTLVKQHFQNFMKRLRKKFPTVRIRYYACGEYGDNLQRPHYHACLFNFNFDDLDPIRQTSQYTLYTSKTLENIWGKGFCTVGALTFETAAYTARYCVKKMNGEKAKDHYTVLVPDTGELIEITPEFTLMSRRPGIGSKWYERYWRDYFPSDEVIHQGRRHKPPRFYAELLKETDPEMYEQMKEMRKQFAFNHRGDNTTKRLLAREQVAKAKFNLRDRNLS